MIKISIKIVIEYIHKIHIVCMNGYRETRNLACQTTEHH